MKQWFWIYAFMVIALTTIVNVGANGSGAGRSSGGSWGSSSNGGWAHK